MDGDAQYWIGMMVGALVWHLLMRLMGYRKIWDGPED